jgi:hypothetical protein
VDAHRSVQLALATPFRLDASDGRIALLTAASNRNGVALGAVELCGVELAGVELARAQGVSDR